MFILIGVGIVSAFAFIFGMQVLEDRQSLKLIEAEKHAQLAIDAQRYEKIREIMTDGIIDGQPAAVEALKPLVDAIAAQMSGEDAGEVRRLEHQNQLELARERNRPFTEWMEKLRELDESCEDVSAYKNCVKAAAESTKLVFGDSFQQKQRALPTVEEQKALPEPKK